MDILLSDLLKIQTDEYDKWTICLNNATKEGIYSFQEDPARLNEHISWKRSANSKTSFRKISTPFCLQFIRLDKDQKWDNWLFLGAYENKGVIKHTDGHETYDLQLLSSYSQYTERLIVQYKKVQGPKQAKIHISNIETMKVVKILEKPYIQVDLTFDGFDKVSLSFIQLKRIIESNVDNWRNLLSNVNCVYVITDNATGKLYIGSTYGYNGIWQRWSVYVNTNGTGNNKELKELIDKDPDYAVKNFQFTVLEPFFNSDGTQNYILERERYWTDIFKTIEFGYNTH